MDAATVIDQHRRAGRHFRAGGVESFAREQGDGPPVLCLHGVPSSCFLCRNGDGGAAFLQIMRSFDWKLPMRRLLDG